jgi:hypothetical protein
MIILRVLENQTTKGNFWFPGYDNINFEGRIEKGSIYLEGSSLEDSVKVERIYKHRHIIIHGDLELSSPATFVVSFSQRKEHYDFLNNGYKINLVFRIVVAYHGKYFDKLDDIKFNSLVVGFQNLGKWITYSDSVYRFRDKEKGKETFKIANKIIEIYYKSPIRPRDKSISDKHSGKVLYVEMKSLRPIKLEKFLDLKNTVLDFFNFFSTRESIIIYSIYGTIIKNDQTEYIDTYYKSPINEKMNKSKIITPFLRSYSDISKKFRRSLKRFYKFRKKGNVAYSYYFGEMYEELPLQIRFFLLCSFLDHYHSNFFHDRSEKLKKNGDELDNILSRLTKANLERSDKKIIRSSLRRHYREVPLADRLKELFEEYKEIIALRIPLLSLLPEREIISSVDLLNLKPLNKSHLIRIVRKKRKLDLSTERRDKYNILIKKLVDNKNLEVTEAILEFPKILFIEVLPKELSKMRNAIAHLKEEFNDIKVKVWYYFVKSLEFICQLYILSEIGFDKKQISEIFFFDDLTLKQKVDRIIQPSIYH